MLYFATSCQLGISIGVFVQAISQPLRPADIYLENAPKHQNILPAEKTSKSEQRNTKDSRCNRIYKMGLFSWIHAKIGKVVQCNSLAIMSLILMSWSTYLNLSRIVIGVKRGGLFKTLSFSKCTYARISFSDTWLRTSYRLKARTPDKKHLSKHKNKRSLWYLSNCDRQKMIEIALQKDPQKRTSLTCVFLHRCRTDQNIAWANSLCWKQDGISDDNK